MSAEMQTEMTKHAATTYWGGQANDRMIQITTLSLAGVGLCDPEEVVQQPGFIQLNFDEAAALHATLAEFIKNEARRRQESVSTKSTPGDP